MLADYNDNNRAPFFNERKTGKQPDRRGTLRINGVDYELSGWNKTTKGGTVLTSLIAKVKQQPATA